MKKSKQRLQFPKSIFAKLFMSYVIFSIVLLVSFILCLIGTMVYFTNGDLKSLENDIFVDENGKILSLSRIEKMGGWVEELDENFCVVQVYGEKKTENTQYTPKEVTSLLNINSSEDNPYVTMMQYVEKDAHYYICFYERSLVNFSMNVTLGNGSQGGTTADRILSISFLALFICNCFVLSLYLKRKIKKPINELVKGMERVKQGEEAVWLDFRADKEFEEIRDTFNLMTRRLQESRQEKEKMERKKQQLLLELSHDIKTPLSTIKSYANALEGELVPKDKLSSYYHTIDQKADRVCSLAENMFLMLKMENQNYRLQLQKLDFCELVRKICAEYYEDIIRQGKELKVEIPEQGYTIWAEEQSLGRVISNLLTNALKYNECGNKIKVQILSLEERKQVELQVLDDGRMIPKELQESIFDAFVRGDKARKSDGGTGLGLAISKAIVEKHKGKIFYQQFQGYNCFVVRLPLTDI
ncbi:MAG: HAMP domain-containing histidine kinase [Lachnospiraceae bacterium]|nr:HAMP domain-containing histidine kinase [Lachnospiraceae bacterium]